MEVCLFFFSSSPRAVLLSDGHLSNFGVENDGLGCGTLPAQAVPLMSLKSSLSLSLSLFSYQACAAQSLAKL